MNDIKERPIILTAQEVNAVLAGNKTQHRVPIKMRYGSPDFLGSRDCNKCDPSLWGWDNFEDGETRVLSNEPCPFGVVSDRLWVRETHHVPDFLKDYEQDELSRGLITRDDLGMSYKADAPHMTPADGGWTSPVAMPRWASRLVLEITDIRIERVQGISESDALASGLIVQKCQQGSQWFLNPTSNMRSNVFHRDEWIGGFASYWDSLNGKLSFNDNPWVWVIEFKVIKESNDG